MNPTIETIKKAVAEIESVLGDVRITSFDCGPFDTARVLVGWDDFARLFAGRLVKNNAEGSFEFMECTNNGVKYATSRRTESADREVVLPPVESGVA